MISIFSKKLLLFLCLSFFEPISAFGLTYLDGSATGCTDGSITYNPSTRSCGSGSDKVYLTVGLFSSNIVASQTNYMRAGTYLRNTGSSNIGALHVTQAGASDAVRTIVKAYPGEERQVILGTATRGTTYNSNPADSTGAGSWLYYPNPAVCISNAGNITVDGVKTYGTTYLVGAVSNITVQNSDLGGGGDGSAGSQGNTVRINGTTSVPGMSNVLISNNLIHDNCRRVEDNAGTALIGYSWSGRWTGNTFYNCWGNDAENKDNRRQAGKNVYLDHNLFLHSTLGTVSADYDTGLREMNQYQEAANIYINNNIFVRKRIAINFADIAGSPQYVYNNTFVENNEALRGADSSGAALLNFYNNLFYSITTDKYLALYSATYITAMNYNVYYSNGVWMNHLTTTWATTLAGWQTYSSKDVDSISSDPLFVNSVGTTAESYKRTSYAENFTGSSYGTHAGAYQTGSEIIGAVFGAAPPTYGIKIYVGGSFQIAPLKVYIGGSWVSPAVKTYIGGSWQVVQ